MNILIYSHTFWPNVGGVEDIGHNLATQMTDLGHVVTVVTPVPSNESRAVSYKIVRNPASDEVWRLVRSSDVVHSNGIAMALLVPALMLGKPFTWAHHGYQLQCIDGAGWVAGAPAPMQPWSSFLHHARIFGLARAASGGIKLALRRIAAQFVSANIPTSEHLALRQPTPRQVVIYNPVDSSLFAVDNQQNAGLVRDNFAENVRENVQENVVREAQRRVQEAPVMFTYIGRLITEKGVDDLLHALAALVSSGDIVGNGPILLKVIGDGPEGKTLQELAQRLNLDGCVEWVGPKVNDALKPEVVNAGVCIIPSAWEEPGALTVMNLMSAGKPLIVSRRGFLSECAGDAALVFENQNRTELADAMRRLGSDRTLQNQLVVSSLERIKKYGSDTSVKRMLKLFEDLVEPKAARAEEVRS